jgi:hypothetical protein
MEELVLILEFPVKPRPGESYADGDGDRDE